MRRDGPVDQRRAGDAFHDETVGHSERLLAEFEICRVDRRPVDKKRQQPNGK